VSTTQDSPNVASESRAVPHWARITFFVAFFLMIWPTEADMLVGTLRHGQLISAVLLAVLCFSVVVALLILSFRRLHLQPLRRHSIPYLIATGAILALNVASVWVIFWNEVHRHI
jgi:hypothetical protein